jgi:hypothetical protein
MIGSVRELPITPLLDNFQLPTIRTEVVQLPTTGPQGHLSNHRGYGRIGHRIQGAHLKQQRFHQTQQPTAAPAPAATPTLASINPWSTIMRCN